MSHRNDDSLPLTCLIAFGVLRLCAWTIGLAGFFNLTKDMPTVWWVVALALLVFMGFALLMPTFKIERASGTVFGWREKWIGWK
jgi:hypothetical protein